MESQQPVAVISGGMGGVGLAVAKQLITDGYYVVLLYYKTAKEIADAWLKENAAGNGEAIQCDLRDVDEVQRVMSQVVERRGGIALAVHAAVDPIVRSYLLDSEPRDVADQFSAGVFGGFNFIKSAAGMMKQQKSGQLIGLLSSSMFEAKPLKMGGYVAAKYALWGMLHEAFLELQASGIRVNAVVPGFMDTKLNSDLPEVVRSFISERSAPGEVCSPEDVARVVSHLCSESGKSVNGKMLSFDGKELRDL